MQNAVYVCAMFYVVLYSMARALRITFSGAFYHVTSRANERKAVFKSKRDRENFLNFLSPQRSDMMR